MSPSRTTSAVATATRFTEPAAVAGATAVTAPLAGTIAEVRVKEGDAVEAGDLLVLLEAMKMEHRVIATAAGSVKRVAVATADVVREGDILVELG
jgi:biotin carboxyl carrier protein